MKKKITFINIISLLILIQPLFDIGIYLFRQTLDVNSILISLIRPLIGLIVYIYLLFSSKVNAKLKKITFIYLLLYCIYSILHLFNIKEYYFISSAGTLFSEIRYLSNYGYYLLQLINFYIIFKITNKEEKKKIIVSIVGATVMLVLLYFASIISKTSLRTYAYSIYKDGFKGWSISAHYIGHSTLLILPIVLYAIFEKKYITKWYKYLILIITIIPGFYLVGTKAPLFGIIGTMIFYSIMYVILIALKKRKINIDFFVLIGITIILLLTFQYTNGYKNFSNQIDVYNKDNVTAKTQINSFINEEDVKNIVEDDPLVINPNKNPELKEFEKRLKMSVKHFSTIDFSVFDNRTVQLKLNHHLRSISPTKDKIFGYGYTTMINCLWVETDAFSVLYSYGVVGFILIILIPLFFLMWQGFKCLFNWKKMSSIKLLLGFASCLAIGLITCVGYTMTFSQTVFYLILLFIISNYEFKNIDYKNSRKHLFMINDLHVGGAEVGMIDVVNELAKTSTVDIVLLRKEGELLPKLNKNINVYGILNSKNSKIKNFIYHFFYFMGGCFTKYVYEKTINTKYEVEIAYLEGYPAVFIASSFNPDSIKIASIRVGLKNHKLSGEKIPLGKFIIKRAFQKMDKIYTVSEETTKEFVEKYPCCKFKTSTIYTYFNVEDIIEKSNAFVPKDLDKKYFNYLAIGRFSEQKGYERLIEAFNRIAKKHKNTKLHILGNYETSVGKEIIELIKKFKLTDKVILHGVINNPYPYIKNCDVLVSSSYYEGYPRVVNEALCLKKLCIGTKVTGTIEALADGKGILVNNNIEGVYEGMESVISNKNIYNEYKENIHKFDGNKESFFAKFKLLSTKKKNMTIFMPKLSYGGMEKALVSLINQADLANRYDLTLYLIYKEKISNYDLLPTNIKIKMMCKGKWNIVGKIKAIFNLGILFINLLFDKSDIAICYSNHHPILARYTRLSSKNNILYVHNNTMIAMSKKRISRFKRIKYGKFNKIICVSEDAKKAVIQKTNRKDKIYVFNNVIDGKTIVSKSEELVNDFKFIKDKIYFVNVCRHDDSLKKTSRIIEATEKLNKKYNNFEVLLIGDGKDTDSYREMIKTKELKNIYVLGSKSNPYQYMKKCNAMVNSSVREGNPVVFIEAMILNLPIITTNVSDALFDVKDKYGYVVKNDDESIYDGMEMFLKKGYTIKNKFDYQKFNNDIINGLYKVYEKK